MRLFLAIRLNPSEQHALRDQTQAILQRKTVKATHSEFYHATIHFFGETSENKTRQLKQALALVEQQSFQYALDGFESFGKHTLYAKIGKGNDAFQRLRKTVERIFKLKPEEFTPHVKIARNNRLHSKEVNKLLEELNQQKKEVVCDATELHLIDSQETPNGRLYHAIAFKRFS